MTNGARIEHFLNGVKVLTADVGSKDFLDAVAKAPARSQRSCPIALQSQRIAGVHPY